MQRMIRVQLHDESVAEAIASAIKKVQGVIQVVSSTKGRDRKDLLVQFWHGTDTDRITEEVKARDERAWIIGNEED